MTSRKRVIEKILSSNLDDKIKNSIKNRIRILKDKGCWTTREDWSHYAGNGLHRKMYIAFIGPIEKNKLICHKCDRPGCINPDHLFQGTNQDNMSDAIRKGRRFTNLVNGGRHLKKWKEEDRIRQLRRFAGE